MKRTTRMLALSVMLIAASFTTTGCAGLSKFTGSLGGIFTPNRANDYAEAFKRYDKEAAAYDVQLKKVAAPDANGLLRPLSGTLTDPQHVEFTALVTNVNNTDNYVNNDLKNWKASGFRPAELEVHADALREAQNKVIAFVKRVRP